ncbi:MAG TPA: di-heme oxidoredictase family protein [Myxococcaceae bacterium]|nr:di-heme oxidoredictase family protein [Myxococcaceae bacterium]
MNVVQTSRTVGLVLLLSGAGCGTGSVGPLPAEPEADQELDPGGASALHVRSQPAAGEQLAGLTQSERDRFASGIEDFDDEETPEDGLGPMFNETSCARCHNVPARGGGSALLETRFGAMVNGHFDPLAQAGGSLIQAKGIGATGACDFVAETVPPEATLTSLRRTTPLFGLGLVDAVPESTFSYVARIEAALFPDEAGRVAKVHDIKRNRTAVGRFGWKNQETTLHQFAGDAYLNEMGITNPEFPIENCPGGDCSLLDCNPLPTLNDDGSGVVALADFMTFLAPFPRKLLTAEAWGGKRVFSSIGCSHCHWDTFRTGDSPVAALNHVTFHPYSDFLLHDMGSLGDGIEIGDAKGREFRTAPLWGISAVTLYLHDGRAATLEDAILAHDGQAKKARDLFVALPAQQQTALFAFLTSL